MQVYKGLRNGHLVVEGTLGSLIDDCVEAAIALAWDATFLKGLVLIFNDKKLDIMKDGRVLDRSAIYRQFHKG